MRLIFTEKEMQNDLHKINLEDDNVDMVCEYLEKEGEEYALYGSAIIDEEVYNEFKIVFALLEPVEDETLENIMNSEWDWYDFDFS